MRDAEDDGGCEGEGEGEDEDNREIQIRTEEGKTLLLLAQEKMSNVKLAKKSREWLNLWLNRECVGFVSNTLLASFVMTAAAICMRCGVFACVYPPLFFPYDTTTTSMLPTNTNHDCEGWGELDGDFGRMWWFGGAEQGVIALLFPRSGTEAGSLTPAPRSPTTHSKSMNTEQILDLTQECEVPRLLPAVACEHAELSHRHPIRSRGTILTGAAALWCSELKIACGTWRRQTRAKCRLVYAFAPLQYCR
ncbi:hypothetical protein B0H14DRAFT_2600249 [Mycena olivaceomarginata]|nr:hypothetical protein B0H14DRAFT_2600249 [Mycena olivaceomarginata]